MLDKFKSVGLEYFENESSFLKRVEMKFLVNKKDLNLILSNFESKYFILDISDKKVFTYNTIYFDTDVYKDYYRHNQGKRLRKKIRTRLYEDSSLCFFEIKLKQKTNTIKKRKKIKLSSHGKFSDDMFFFANENYLKYYSKYLKKNRFPSIGTRYKRITLLSKNHKEKITFDFDFQFSNLRKDSILKKEKTDLFEENNMMIIEIKSSIESSFGYKTIRNLGFRNIEYGCSKYCLGLNLLKMVKKGNKFKPVLKKIKNL